MKFQIIFATGNQNKVREAREILDETPFFGGTLVKTMKEVGLSSDPEETGKSFEENALIKARALAALLPKRDQERREFAVRHGFDPDIPIVVLSDDSGLCIDALNGEPGIYSARYMGHDTSYTDKMNAILERMKDVPDERRGAKFAAAIAAVLPDGREYIVRGEMPGRIARKIAGSNGFGYDPFFYLPEYGKTSAEIAPEEKNAISHRGKALRAMFRKLKEL